jgi:Rod binding domain-containing protein
MTVNPLAQVTAAVKGQNQGPGASKDDNKKIMAAARQFESVLLTQLLQVLWKSSPEMTKGQGGMYQSMYEGAFADHLAAGGGIGLADVIAKGLGAKIDPGARRHVESLPTKLAGMANPLVASGALNPRIAAGMLGTQSSSTASANALGSTAGVYGGAGALAAQANESPVGVMADVSAAASGMLAGGGQQWAKQGRLAPDDFGSVAPLASAAADGGEALSSSAGAHARQTVRNSFGYQGYYKCNLFAFELARRAGLDVPVTTRGAGVNFPSSNRLAQDASDGSLDTGWAKVATGASPAAMQDVLHAGEAAFMLVGQGQGERHGHMAVIEHPRSIDYDSDGKIRSISFDGWEAQPDGAKHLTQRTWNRAGHAGGPHDRNGLERIELIQLNRAATGAASGAPSAPHVGPAHPAKFGLK